MIRNHRQGQTFSFLLLATKHSFVRHCQLPGHYLFLTLPDQLLCRLPPEENFLSELFLFVATRKARRLPRIERGIVTQPFVWRKRNSETCENTRHAPRVFKLWKVLICKATHFIKGIFYYILSFQSQVQHLKQMLSSFLSNSILIFPTNSQIYHRLTS